MARPRESLADRLARAEKAASEGVIRSEQLSRRDREVLTDEGWLSPVMRGWYLLSTPPASASKGESTAWFSSIWSFLRVYLTHRYGDGWCLSAGDSLALHAGDTRVPRQVVVIAAHGGAATQQLPHDTSLLVYPDPAHLPEEVVERAGLRLMAPAEALLRAPNSWFRTNPQNGAVVLRSLSDPMSLARQALGEGPIDGYGRLIGALRALGDDRAANNLAQAAEEAGRSITETNPFDTDVPKLGRLRTVSPYAARVADLWARLRDGVEREWDQAEEPIRQFDYLKTAEQRSARDAWHSLSIEGYRVTPELIEAVREGRGVQSTVDENRLAAAGYLRAQKAVLSGIQRVLGGEDSAGVARDELDGWYRSMFAPHVEAGLVTRSDLLGYRRHPVFIRGSRHVPPPYDAVPEAMEQFYAELEKEREPSVRAVLGHFLFTWIHPFGDGNGRLGRFLMNLQLAAGGFPWTVLRVERRVTYMESLESASVQGDIGPFARFVLEEMQAGGTGT